MTLSIGHPDWAPQLSILHLVEDIHYHRDIYQSAACSIGSVSDGAMDGLHPTYLTLVLESCKPEG